MSAHPLATRRSVLAWLAGSAAYLAANAALPSPARRYFIIGDPSRRWDVGPQFIRDHHVLGCRLSFMSVATGWRDDKHLTRYELAFTGPEGELAHARQLMSTTQPVVLGISPGWKVRVMRAAT